MSPFTRTSPPAFCWDSVSLFSSYQNLVVFSPVTPPLCQGYLYTSFPPQQGPSASCSCFFPYLALPSPFFPVFPLHFFYTLVFFFFLMLFSHAVLSCQTRTLPIIICLENKSCRISTSLHRKGSNHSPCFFFLSFFLISFQNYWSLLLEYSLMFWSCQIWLWELTETEVSSLLHVMSRQSNTSGFEMHVRCAF